MNRILVLPNIVLLLVAGWGAAGVLAQPATHPLDGVPSIEQMASQWLDVTQITQMPSLHNFHEMAACAPTLLGVNYYPGRQLFVYPVTTRWYEYNSLPKVSLKINGEMHESTTCRWYPYQAVRRAALDGLEIETTVRMVFEGPGILYRVCVKNVTNHTQSVEVSIRVPGELVEARDDPGYRTVTYDANDLPIQVAHAWATSAERVETSDGFVTASWHPQLAPGASRRLQLVMAHTLEGAPPDGPSASIQAQRWAHSFQRTWEQAESLWDERWHDAFTPGNEHFSGNLPTLLTDDAKLSDIYYRSILTLLVLHRTNLNMCDRVFITSGERHKGNVFYWDTSMWSRVFALLEPRGMKEQLRLFLQADPHGGFVYDMDTGTQGDGWYAANDMTMFRLAINYLAVTDDAEFLEEEIGDRTVLAHLEKLATNWQELQRDKTVMLADYGENENLLECAPSYVHRVPSFNAANVWMMRAVANIHEQRGNLQRAGQLRRWANEIALAVLDLYKPGDGVWHALHRDGRRVELRHCYDFVCIGKFIPTDLSAQTKREMVDFVRRELLTDTWMRAMSFSDQAADVSDRPDHGPFGAFAAWPALTADTMCELGAWNEAVDFVRRTQAVLYEGVYGQAHEFFGPNRMEHDAPVRLALRGACMRECVGGGAFAEWTIGTLFGFSPVMYEKLSLRGASIDRGLAGELRNVRYRGEWIDITSDSRGVTYRRHP